MPAEARRATYRLQLRPDFGFDDAAPSPYLAQLGVSHLYLSPILQAAPGAPTATTWSTRPGSTPSSAGDEGHGRLAERPSAAGLGQLLDVVPNHMAITGRDNPGGGTSSRTARPASTPPTSTSTGTRPSPSCATSCCCRSSVTTTAGCSRPGELPVAAGGRRLRRSATSTTPRPSPPRTSTPCSRARRPRWAGDQRPRATRRRRLDSSWRASPPPSAKLPPPTAHRRPTASRSATGTRRSSGAGWRRCASRHPAVAEAIDAEVARSSTPTSTRLDALLDRQNYPTGVVAHRRRGARLPPLLRHQRPGRHPGRGPAGVRRQPPLILDWLHDGVDRRHPHRPRRRARATRPPTSTGCRPPRPGPGSWSRRSSRATRPCRRLAGGRDDRLRLAEPGRLGAHRRRRARRGRRDSTAGSRVIDRALRGDGPRRPRSRSSTGRSPPTSAGWRPASPPSASGIAATGTTPAGTCATPWPQVLAGFRVYRTYVRVGRARHRGERRRRSSSRPCSDRRRSATPTSTTSCSASCATCCSGGFPDATSGELGAALPAAQRPGDGQGGRGHRLLPLPARARGSTRSAGTPGGLGVALDAFHRANVDRPARRDPRPCSPPPPTTPSGARTSGPACRVLAEDARRVGGGRRAVAGPSPPPPGRGAAGPQHGVARLPDLRRGLAHRRRPAGGLPGQGHPGGQGAHVVDRSRRVLRQPARTMGRGRRSATRTFVADVEAFVGASAPARVGGGPGPEAGHPDRARESRTSTRAASAGTSRWWTPTTAVRSTTTAAGGCSARSRETTAADAWAAEDGDGADQAGRGARRPRRAAGAPGVVRGRRRWSLPAAARRRGRPRATAWPGAGAGERSPS